MNSISPGPIAGTEGMRELASPGEQEKNIAAVPLRRLGTLDDIAHLVMFLASPYASYISGALIPWEGGGAGGPPIVSGTIRRSGGAAHAARAGR